MKNLVNDLVRYEKVLLLILMERVQHFVPNLSNDSRRQMFQNEDLVAEGGAEDPTKNPFNFSVYQLLDVISRKKLLAVGFRMGLKGFRTFCNF